MKFFARKRTQRIINLTFAAVLVVSSITAGVPFLFTKKADAAPGVTYTPTTVSAGDWSVDRQAPSGGYTVSGGQVTLNVDQTQSNPDAFYKTEGISKSVAAGTDSIKGDLYVADDWAAKPSLRAGLWGVTQDAGQTGPSYPIIEFATIGGYSGWRVWDANTGVWHNVSASTNLNAYNTVEIVVSKNVGATGTYSFYVNNQKVYAYDADNYTTFTSLILNNYNLGTGNTADNYTVKWQNFETGTLPVVAQCTTTSEVKTTSLTGNWNTSDTRDNGHNELTANGLHVYTQGNTSLDKAAGYHAADFALQAAGTPAFDLTFNNSAATTAQPGLQLVVDFNNDGTVDGTLVGEAAYPNDWWLTNSSAQFAKDGAPLHTGGSGSTNHGSLNGWLEAFPNARVKAIGYSMGSGVYGDVTINSMTFGCVNYTFGLDTVAPSKPVLALPANGSTIPTNDFDFDWNDSTDDNPGITYEFQSSQDPSRDSNGVLNGNGIWHSGSLPTSNMHSSGAPDGAWFYQVRAKDASGNYSPWSDIWSVTIDTQAPTAPVITYPNGWHQDVTNIQWNASQDTSAVTYAVYEGTHPNDVNTLIADGITGTSLAQTFAPGPHQIRVVAKDAFGRTTSSSTVGFQVIGTPQITLPTEGLILNAANGNAYTAQWTAAYGVGGTKNYEIEYGIDSNNNGTIESNELQYRTVSGTQLERTQTFSSNFQGAMTIRVRAVYNIPINGSDRGPWSTLVHYSRDTIKPAAPTVTADGVANGGSTKNGSVNILWNKPSTDTARYDYRVWTNIPGDPYNGQANAYTETGLTGNSRTGAFTQGEGTYFVQVRAIDAAGNASDWSNTFAVTYDTTKPSVQITSPTNGATFGNGVTVNIEGTTGDATSYTFSIGNTGSTPLVSTSGTSFSAYNWNTAGVPSGAYIATLTGTDAAGNSNTFESVINIDNTAPAVSIDPQTNTAGNQPTITGTVDDANATLVANFQGSNYSVVNNNGSYSFTVPNALSNGTYSFTITATDVNGNAASRTANVIVNVPAPQASGQTTTTVTPIITNPAAAAVLGATTDNNGAADTGVKGTSDSKDKAAEAVNSDANQGKVFGLSWYWWLLILAAAAALAWLIAALVRRRNAENA